MGQITRVGGDVDTRLEKAGRVDQMWMKKVLRSILNYCQGDHARCGFLSDGYVSATVWRRDMGNQDYNWILDN